MDETAQLQWERLATNLRVEEALLEVLELLKGFRVVVFKGGLLTRQIYGDLRQRASADNDIWIEEPDCRRALEILLYAGYRPLEGLEARAALRRYGQVALWPDQDMDRVSIDLHAEPFMGSLFTVEREAIQRHIVETSLHERSVLTFDEYLAFVHMVAHFLQHRLERDHLEEIGAAWEKWDLDESRLRALARSTCSEPALEHAIHLCSVLGHCRKAPLPRTTRRARLCALLDGASRSQLPPTKGRLASFLLAAPHRLPGAVVSAILLEDDDRISRYGPGSRLRQTWLRALELVTRG